MAVAVFFASLFLALAGCYITSTITDYLKRRPHRSRGERAITIDGTWHVQDLRRDLDSAERELGQLRPENARLREENAKLRDEVAATRIFGRDVA